MGLEVGWGAVVGALVGAGVAAGWPPLVWESVGAWVTWAVSVDPPGMVVGLGLLVMVVPGVVSISGGFTAMSKPLLSEPLLSPLPKLVYGSWE